VFGNLSVLDNVLIGGHTRLRAVRPRWPLIGSPAELALALIRPHTVRAEEQALRAEVLDILGLFGERLLPQQDQPAYSLT
jgi:branched-chain amino acid transport system ATP-binding protein